MKKDVTFLRVSYDAVSGVLFFVGCNSVSKLLPIIVNMDDFRETLHNALDVIGKRPSPHPLLPSAHFNLLVALPPFFHCRCA